MQFAGINVYVPPELVLAGLIVQIIQAGVVLMISDDVITIADKQDEIVSQGANRSCCVPHQLAALARVAIAAGILESSAMERIDSIDDDVVH